MFSWWSKTIYYDVRHDCDEWKGDSISSMCLDMQLYSSTSKIRCWYSHHRILVEHCRNFLSEYSSGSKYPCWHLNVSVKKNIHNIYINYIQGSYVFMIKFSSTILYIYMYMCVQFGTFTFKYLRGIHFTYVRVKTFIHLYMYHVCVCISKCQWNCSKFLTLFCLRFLDRRFPSKYKDSNKLD